MSWCSTVCVPLCADKGMQADECNRPTEEENAAAHVHHKQEHQPKPDARFQGMRTCVVHLEGSHANKGVTGQDNKARRVR